MFLVRQARKPGEGAIVVGDHKDEICSLPLLCSGVCLRPDFLVRWTLKAECQTNKKHERKSEGSAAGDSPHSHFRNASHVMVDVAPDKFTSRVREVQALLVWL